MILQKDLIAESGLKHDTATKVIRRLRKADEVRAEKDRFQNNQISYSDEDAEKIKQALHEEKEKLAAARARTGKTKDTPNKKAHVGSGTAPPAPKETAAPQPKPKAASSSKDTSVKDFVEKRGPEMIKAKPKEKEKDEEGEKPVPLYKTPVFYIGAGLLLLGLIGWLYQRYRQKQQPEAKAVEILPPSPRTQPTLADQYRVM